MLLPLKFWVKRHVEQRSALFNFLQYQYQDVNKARTVFEGVLPDHVIIGAQKSGKPALYTT